MLVNALSIVITWSLQVGINVLCKYEANSSLSLWDFSKAVAKLIISCLATNRFALCSSTSRWCVEINSLAVLISVTLLTALSANSFFNDAECCDAGSGALPVLDWLVGDEID